MHDNRTHPLLAQVPLTVSPFVSLPAATTLPYTYKPMPSTLPPSATGVIGTAPGGAAADEKPRFVVSPSGHAAHPDDIVASCRALRRHLDALQAGAERDLRALEDRIAARELAEKRRVAPGWLDSEARLLEPERAAGAEAGADGDAGLGREGVVVGERGFVRGAGANADAGGSASEMGTDQGAELDRAFGGMGLS